MKIFLDANICLDLLDSKRDNSKSSIEWYLKNKDNSSLEFYFSADFITTIFYNLTQKRKVPSLKVLEAIDLIIEEIKPIYLSHNDYELASESLLNGKFNDFEDLLVLSSAYTIGANIFLTNDKELLKLKEFKRVKILSIKETNQKFKSKVLGDY